LRIARSKHELLRTHWTPVELHQEWLAVNTAEIVQPSKHESTNTEGAKN